MRFLLSIYILLFVVFNATAQEYDEVVFEVKKKQVLEERRTYYYASDTLDSRSNTRGYAYMHVIKRGDTLSYHSAYQAYKWKEPLTGVRSISLSYEQANDTLLANIQYGNNAPPNRVCVFVKNGVALNGYAIASKLLPPFQDKTTAVYYKGTSNVTIGDSTYQCIKLIEVTPYIYRGFLLHIRESVFFKYKRKMYDISIHYIREDDFLPIRIIKAEPIRKYLPETEIKEEHIEWELVHVK